jgi:hypothetical protein
LWLLRRERARRDLAQPTAVGLRAVEHHVERRAQPLEVTVRQVRCGHARCRITVLDAARRHLEILQRRERQPQDDGIRDYADHEPHTQQRGKAAILVSRRRTGDRAAPEDHEHDDARIRDQDLVEERNAQQQPDGPAVLARPVGSVDEGGGVVRVQTGSP